MSKSWKNNCLVAKEKDFWKKRLESRIGRAGREFVMQNVRAGSTSEQKIEGAAGMTRPRVLKSTGLKYQSKPLGEGGKVDQRSNV